MIWSARPLSLLLLLAFAGSLWASTPGDGTTITTDVLAPLKAKEKTTPAPAARPAAGTSTPKPAALAVESPAPRPTASEPGVPVVVSFEEDLFQRADIALNGITGRHTIPFSRPRTLALTGDPVLRLRFSHSSELLPDLSSLSVMVNGLGIASVALDHTNQAEAELVARIPLSILRDYNELTLAVVQHYTRDCEDPFDPTLWTRVSRDSNLTLPGTRLQVSPLLEDFPFPFYDDRGYGPLNVTFVLPASLSPELVDAAGRLAFAFGRIADYRGVNLEPPVISLDQAKTAAVVMGTFADIPSFREQLSQQPVSDQQGVLAVLPNPADGTLPVLVVSGRTPEAVRTAAMAISQRARREALTGGLAYVEAVATGEAWPTREGRARPIPFDTTEITLNDINFENTTVRGFYAAPIIIPLTLQGDDVLLPPGGNVKLIYSYGANFNTDLSTLEVTLDGTSIKSVALSNPDGEQRAEVDIRIPVAQLHPSSELRVLFQMYPKKFGACELVTDRHLWGTIWDDSTLVLPRTRVAEVPDLGLLRYRYWPFTADRPDEPVLVAVSDAPSAAEVIAGASIVAKLGEVSAGDGWPVRLVTSAGVPVGPKQRVISLVTGAQPHGRYDALRGAGLVTAEGDASRRLLKESGTMLTAQLRDEWRTIEEVAAGDSVDLLIRGASAGDNQRSADGLANVELVQELSGNLAVLGEGDQVNSLRLAKRSLIGATLPTRVRRHWAWTFALAVPLAAAAGWALRRWVLARGGRTA